METLGEDLMVVEGCQEVHVEGGQEEDDTLRFTDKYKGNTMKR